MAANRTDIIIAPINIQGRLRPQRDFVVSVICPIKGSVIASIIRDAESARPIYNGLIPIPTPNIGYAKLNSALLARFSANPPMPQEIFRDIGSAALFSTKHRSF